MRIEQLDLPNEQITKLSEDIAAADGTPMVNDLGRLALQGTRPMRCLAAMDGSEVIGFALIDDREYSVQLGVSPRRRREGTGTALVNAARAYGPQFWWSFGSLPAAAQLALTHGMQPIRQLLVMERELRSLEVPWLPEGYEFDTFKPSDVAAVVGVNAAAFAHHPEQGHLTIDDFNAMTSQPWFDPQGLILVRRGGEVVGFHWTKSHSPQVGEVYVIGVNPEFEGLGLGRALLNQGLRYLASTGHARVQLYVESSATRVVAMYEAATFVVIHSDTCYAQGPDYV